MTQKILRILSAIILLYLSIVLFGLPLGMLAEYPNDLPAILTIVLASFPGVILFVTAYRQLFRQRRGLVILSCVIFIIASVIMISSLYFMKDDYAAFQNHIAGQLQPGDAEAFFPALDLKSMLLMTIFNASLLIIPIYTNFRKNPSFERQRDS